MYWHHLTQAFGKRHRFNLDTDLDGLEPSRFILQTRVRLAYLMAVARIFFLLRIRRRMTTEHYIYGSKMERRCSVKEERNRTNQPLRRLNYRQPFSPPSGLVKDQHQPQFDLVARGNERRLDNQNQDLALLMVGTSLT